MPLPQVILRARRARPFFGLHPWVYAGAIERVEGTAIDGAEVDLVSSAGTFIARGFYNSQSKLRVRLYTWSAEIPLDDAFFRGQIEQALRLRRDILRLPGPGHGTRLIFSEADGLSGLIVDQYDRWLTVQFTSLALAQRREMIGDLLEELIRPDGIYLRTERGIGQLEGLELHDGLWRGQVPSEPISLEENGLHFLVNLAEGQKTGSYLDQRDNHRVVAALCPGRRVLDAFCYSGGFALHAAQAGATSVLGIDVSEPALSLGRTNAERNGISNVTFEKAEVFDHLDQLVQASEKFGVVILDPPKFARSQSAIEEALRGYRRILTLAFRLLEREGILVMCCCSGLIGRDQLHELLAQVSAAERRPLQILESRGAAPDHPVSVTCPETSYLKCIIGRVL